MDRPMIFSAPMVRALLDGRKTQTRRVSKKQDWHEAIVRRFPRQKAMVPYAPSDRLWVKEATRRAPDIWTYDADGAEVGWPGRQAMATWTRDTGSPMFLPRAASRLTLIVTDVRVQRLQDISEEDAKAEGAMLHVPCKSAVAGTTIASNSWYYDQDLGGRLYEDTTARGAYEILWGKIHGWKSWDANPWVVAVTFEVVNANIDAMPIPTATRPVASLVTGGAS